MVRSLVWLAFAVIVCFGQTASPRFEVASVKPSGEDSNASSGIGTGQGRLNAHNVTLLRCILGAYGIGPTEVAGGPKWLNEDRFDILAKAEEEINSDSVMMLMLRDLLAERFKLVLHREARAIPVFVLELNKNGHKMKATEGEGTTNTRGSNGSVSMDVQNTNMDRFARTLSREMDRPVINRTGLDETFSFHLQWTKEGRAPSGDAGDSPSIFTAIQEQLGLRLQSERAPVEILVIDSAERPSEN